MNSQDEREWVESAAREHARREHAAKVLTPSPASTRQSRFTAHLPHKTRELWGGHPADWAVLAILLACLVAGGVELCCR